MIEIEKLRKSYGKSRALNGVSLAATPGTVTGVLGPNGCGKTTLIKSILGLVVPDSGDVRVMGRSVVGAHEYRQKIGYMPQNPEFPGNLSIRELLDMLENIRGARAARRNELVDLFRLEPHMNKSFATLSGGTKQKVAAVSAFMFNPEILILDEPTVGLDPVAMMSLKGLVAREAEAGRTVVLVTHMVSEIEQLVDRMVFMLEGEIWFSGTLDEAREKAGTPRLDEAVINLIKRVQTAPSPRPEVRI